MEKVFFTTGVRNYGLPNDGTFISVNLTKLKYALNCSLKKNKIYASPKSFKLSHNN